MENNITISADVRKNPKPKFYCNSPDVSRPHHEKPHVSLLSVFIVPLVQEQLHVSDAYQ